MARQDGEGNEEPHISVLSAFSCSNVFHFSAAFLTVNPESFRGKTRKGAKAQGVFSGLASLRLGGFALNVFIIRMILPSVVQFLPAFKTDSVYDLCQSPISKREA
jgi:hypothetical protein